MSSEERNRLVFVINDQQARIRVLQGKIELLERMVKIGDDRLKAADVEIKALREWPTIGKTTDKEKFDV